MSCSTVVIKPIPNGWSPSRIAYSNEQIDVLQKIFLAGIPSTNHLPCWFATAHRLWVEVHLNEKNICQKTCRNILHIYHVHTSNKSYHDNSSFNSLNGCCLSNKMHQASWSECADWCACCWSSALFHLSLPPNWPSLGFKWWIFNPWASANYYYYSKANLKFCWTILNMPRTPIVKKYENKNTTLGQATALNPKKNNSPDLKKA